MTRRALMLCIAVMLTGYFAATSSEHVQGSAGSQTALPPACGDLGEIVTQPIVDPSRFCPEYLVQALPHSDLATITSIAFAPPCEQLGESRDWCGRLFFVRPDEGTMMWVGAFDPETRTYALETFATGLDMPNGLTWYEGAWYVSGDSAIYRLTDDNGDNAADNLEIIADDLPHGVGYWTGSIGVGPDDRLYVSKGASCNACEESDPRRASILSYRLNGSDEQVFALGLRNTFDFAWHPHTHELWAAESGREYMGEDLPLDELNRITGAGQHFGWPYCYSTADGSVADRSLFDFDPDICEETVSPALTFPAHSSPAGLVFYEGAAFPEYDGDLLVVASGLSNRRIPSGHALYRVCFDRNGNLETCLDVNGQPVLNEQGSPTSRERLVPVDSYYGYGLDVLQIQGQSFYPEHPVDVAISPEGWIVVSVMEGRLIQLRPATR